MKRILNILFLFILPFLTFAQTVEVPFTLEDRDRIIRTEQKVESLRNEMNARFEGVDQKFDGMNQKFEGMNQKFEAMNQKFEAMDKKIEVLYWGFGIVITLILFLFGYIIFDRKTGIKVLERETNEMKISHKQLIFVLKEYAKENPKLADLLKNASLF